MATVSKAKVLWSIVRKVMRAERCEKVCACGMQISEGEKQMCGVQNDSVRCGRALLTIRAASSVMRRRKCPRAGNVHDCVGHRDAQQNHNGNIADDAHGA